MASFLDLIIIIMMIKVVVNLVCREKNITTLNKNETLIYPINNELLIYPIIIKENFSFNNYNEIRKINISFPNEHDNYVM